MLPTQSVNFDSSTAEINQSIISQIHQSQLCQDFPRSIYFSDSHPQSELVRKGFCQLLLYGFRDYHDRLQAKFQLPELSEEPSITMYDDNTYSISWCPDFIYRMDKKEVMNHELYCQLLAKNKKLHQRYIDGELKAKKEMEKKIEAAFEEVRQAPQLVEDPRVGQLQAELASIKEQLALKERELKQQKLRTEEILAKSQKQSQQLEEEFLKELDTLQYAHQKKLADKDSSIQLLTQLSADNDKEIQNQKEIIKTQNIDIVREKRRNSAQIQKYEHRLTELQREDGKKFGSGYDIRKETREQKKKRLMKEMKALGDSWLKSNKVARQKFVREHLSPDLKQCLKPGSFFSFCDRDDSCRDLVCTQRLENKPENVHLQCWLVYLRKESDSFPELAQLVQAIEPLLDFWV